MKVTEHLKNTKKPTFSMEIVPPPRGTSCKTITDIVEELKKYNPPFIDVTSHSAEAYYEDMQDGKIKRHIRKKRPGTISISGIIQNRFNIDTVVHMLSRGFTREETEDGLIELNYLGIQNVMALRGDEMNYITTQGGRTVNHFSVDLIKQIVDLRNGKYIENIENSEPIDFCIGVGAYPEKHFESPNLLTDIKFLKQKIDAGGDYIVTQMFFDNEKFYKFNDLCKKEKIQAPIIPGIKILNRKSQLNSLPKNFFIDIPNELVEKINKNPSDIEKIGVEWAYNQAQDLIKNGFLNVHFFVMNDTTSVIEVIKEF